MLNLLVPALWILFDVLICLRTGYMTGPFPRWEWWLWLLVGVALAVLAVFAGWYDRKQTAKEAAKRHEQLQQGQETLARGGVATLTELRRLAEVTETIGEPPGRIMGTATAKIETLRAEVSDLQGMFWRPVRDNETVTLIDLLRHLGVSPLIRIAADPQTDCIGLGRNLCRIFESAGWHLEPRAVTTGTWESAGASGIRIQSKYGDVTQVGSKLMDVLRPFVKGGISHVANLESSELVDLVVIIGPKIAPSQWP